MRNPDWDSIYSAAERSGIGEQIQPFIKHIQDSDVKPSSARSYLKALISLSKLLNGTKLCDTTPAHLVQLRESIENRSTRRNYTVTLRRYFRFIDRSDLIEHLPYGGRRAIKDSNKLDTDTVPTRDDIVLAIENCHHPRDRAIIALLADLGLRAHELLALRIIDIDMDAPVPTVRVSAETKTGARLIPIIPYHNSPAFSPPEIAVWLTQHPDKDDTKAPLFPTYGYGSSGEAMSYEALKKVLKTIYSRAGIERPPRAHKLRDFCVMERAVQLTDAELEAFMGWTEGSEMRKRYTTAAGVRARLLERANQIAGVEPDDHKNQEAPKCWKCKELLPLSARYCPRCASKQPTGEERISLEEKAEVDRTAAGIINQVHDSPELLRELLKQLSKK